MLGQPVYFLTPDVVGVHMTGRLREGVTATDLVLTVTEMLRQGEGRRQVRRVPRRGRGVARVPDRATIANMAPEYGATIGLLPRRRGVLPVPARDGPEQEHVDAFRSYYQAQGLFGMPQRRGVRLPRSSSSTSRPFGRASPVRSGRRTASTLPELKERSARSSTPAATAATARAAESSAGLRDAIGVERRTPEYRSPAAASRSPATSRRGAAAKDTNPLDRDRDGEQPADADRVGRTSREESPPRRRASTLGHGDVVIAAITSCTNTSNPGVMLGGRHSLAKKAVERGLTFARGEDVARARLARRHRVPRADGPAAVSRPARLPPRRVRLHDVHRQLGPARPRSRRPSRATTSSRRACSPETETSRRASSRTSRRTSS